MSKITAFKPNFIYKFSKTSLVLRKHAPAILTGAGIVGTITSIVLACRATLKIEEVLDESKETIKEIKDNKEEIEEGKYKKELTKAYVKTGFDISKLYAPSFFLTAASIGCFVGSHQILTKRNVALIAAYKAVESSFSQYRKRVVDMYGIEKDRELKFGLEKTKVDVETTDAKGKKKIIKEDAIVVDKEEFKKYSQYARFFDEFNRNWERSPEYNLLFLRKAQNWANDKLRAQGHLFLNEVYDMLDIPRTKEGSIVGWVFDNLHGEGDNYVDFGIYDISFERSHAFVNGYEASILLDFNVDGVIYDLI